MTTFVPVSRQKFRQCFQPSRIALAVFQPPQGPPNVITLAFDMYCSYKPNMMAFAVHKKSYSHQLQQSATGCVLSIPGESLADFTMYCGTTSGRDADKIKESGIALVQSRFVEAPGLEMAIANVELELTHRLLTGDHTTLVCRVISFNVNPDVNERCLLSVGPKHDGYHVLVRKGIHRIGVVSSGRSGTPTIPEAQKATP